VRKVRSEFSKTSTQARLRALVLEREARFKKRVAAPRLENLEAIESKSRPKAAR
jgi:hypothetical protein